MKDDDQLKRHIEMMATFQVVIPSGFYYSGMYDFISKHGKYFQEFVPELPKASIEAYPRACFDNSYKIAHFSKGKLFTLKAMLTASFQHTMPGMSTLRDESTTIPGELIGCWV